MQNALLEHFFAHDMVHNFIAIQCNFMPLLYNMEGYYSVTSMYVYDCWLENVPEPDMS